MPYKASRIRIRANSTTLPSIIAVTGWNGKPIWSWKPENSRHVWLRDWLGRDLADRSCAARVFTYGYPSTVARSDNDASLHDYGANLLASLATARRKEFEVNRFVPNCRSHRGEIMLWLDE